MFKTIKDLFCNVESLFSLTLCQYFLKASVVELFLTANLANIGFSLNI